MQLCKMHALLPLFRLVLLVLAVPPCACQTTSMPATLAVSVLSPTIQ